MKKLILGLVALVTAGTLMAGSVDYLSNQSADYLRTFSRNASLDADAAVYNPAGTAFLPPGLTLGLSNQSIFKLYENDFSLAGSSLNSVLSPNAKNYQSTEPTLLLPNGQAIWNGGPWAAFLSTGVTAGGGTAVYNDGVPFMVVTGYSVLQGTQAKLTAALGASAPTLTSMTITGNITATSLYPQLTLGGAYAVTDFLSLSAALRSVYGYKTFSGKANFAPFSGSTAITSANSVLAVDATQTALGFGGIFGADWKAYQGLLVTARFETATPLQFTTKINGASTNTFGTLFTDGKTEQKDLPALAALGVRYDWEALSVTASGTGYFLGASRTSTYLVNYNDFGWEAGLSAEYAVMPGFLRLSAGGQWTTVGGGASTYNDFDFSLDSTSVGGGAVVTVIKDLDATLAVSKTFYTSAKGNQASTKYTNFVKDAFTIDIGVQYKLF